MENPTLPDILRQTIDQFWETVPGVWNLIRNHLRSIAAEQFGISVGQFHTLRHVRKGLTSVRDIAEARQVSRPAVSQEVDVLVEGGLVTRRQEAGDRRFVHLALTPAGEDLLNRLFQQNRLWMMQKMAELPAADLEQIRRGLALLESAFQATGESQEPSSTTQSGA
jgi:DNA-binding MarR family transcriptional regulator